jgi:hypothetical protein
MFVVEIRNFFIKDHTVSHKNSPNVRLNELVKSFQSNIHVNK